MGSAVNTNYSYTILAILAITVFIVSLSIGRYPVNIFNLDKVSAAVLLEVRLPRIIMGIILGAVLGCSSAALQAILRNPLASPYVLGVTQGAAFGAGLAMLLLPPEPYVIPLFSFCFALTAVLIALTIARIQGVISPIVLVLSGILVGAMFMVGLSIIQWIIDPWRLHGLIFWLMGGLYRVSWSSYPIALPGAILGLVLLTAMRWRLNILSLSEYEARSLGVNVGRERLIVLALSAGAVASVTCVSGIVAFIGLIIPHIARAIFGADNRVLIPASIAVGSIILPIADTLCRSLLPSEIPLSIVTTTITVPYLAYLLRRVATRWAI